MKTSAKSLISKLSGFIYLVKLKKEQWSFLLLTILTISDPFSFYSGTNNFEIIIERKLSSESCTMGYMIADDAVIAYTLELPWKDNNNNISCIPNGTYKGILRYDKNDKWRIELKDVPDRTNVQIHVGNFTKETKGCILVGNDADINGCAIKGSTTAYKKLKEAFYGNTNPSSTPNRDILLTIK